VKREKSFNLFPPMSKVLLIAGKVILNFILISVVPVCQNFSSASPRQLLIRYIPAGTRIQMIAWELASPHVTEYVNIAVTTPDNQRHWIQPIFRGRLSLADTIVLVHRLGIVHAAEIVTVVDPWQYPEETMAAGPGIKGYIQRAVDTATHAGKNILDRREQNGLPGVAIAVSEQAMPSSHLKGQVRVHLRHARAVCVSSHRLGYAWAHGPAE